MHLHNCRCFQMHLIMLLQRLIALCLDPRGLGSSWKYTEAEVGSTRVFGRLACAMGTDIHVPDISMAVFIVHNTYIHL